MKRVCLVNGSPRGAKATSLVFLRELERMLAAAGLRTSLLSVALRSGEPTPAVVIEELAAADAIVFSFPLYAYTTPAVLTRLLEELYERLASGAARREDARAYAIVNCAYADPGINSEALRVMRLFSWRAGLRWRFGVAIGGGMVVAMTRWIPLVRWQLQRVYRLVRGDLLGDGSSACGDVFLRPILPRALMVWAKDSKWARRFMARQPGAVTGEERQGG